MYFKYILYLCTIMILDTYKKLVSIFKRVLKRYGYSYKKQGDTFIFRKKGVSIVFFRDGRFGETPMTVYFVCYGLINDKIIDSRDDSYTVYKKIIKKVKEYEPQEF